MTFSNAKQMSKAKSLKDYFSSDNIVQYDFIYDLTISPLKTDRVYYKEDIDKVIDKIRSKGYEISDIVYEVSPIKKALHCHCIFYSKHYINKYKFPKRKGWQLYTTGRSPSAKWLSYIHKTSRNVIQQEQILIEHYALHNNMFSPFSETEALASP